MRTIRVDEEVYTYLEDNALSYVETEPNQTLRRLFNLDQIAATKPQSRTAPKERTKKPKANLLTLQRAGIIRAGEALYLHDYSGARIDGAEARVSGRDLIWNAESHSMSRLAATLLQQHGYASDSVRGPAHWYTASGTSIKDLWQKYRQADEAS